MDIIRQFAVPLSLEKARHQHTGQDDTTEVSILIKVEKDDESGYQSPRDCKQSLLKRGHSIEVGDMV